MIHDGARSLWRLLAHSRGFCAWRCAGAFHLQSSRRTNAIIRHDSTDGGIRFKVLTVPQFLLQIAPSHSYATCVCSRCVCVWRGEGSFGIIHFIIYIIVETSTSRVAPHQKLGARICSVNISRPHRETVTDHDLNMAK